MANIQPIFPHAILNPTATRQLTLEPEHDEQNSYSFKALFESLPNIVLNRSSLSSSTSVLLPGDLECDMLPTDMLGTCEDMEGLDSTPTTPVPFTTSILSMVSTFSTVPAVHTATAAQATETTPIENNNSTLPVDNFYTLYTSDHNWGPIGTPDEDFDPFWPPPPPPPTENPTLGQMDNTQLDTAYPSTYTATYTAAFQAQVYQVQAYQDQLNAYYTQYYQTYVAGENFQMDQASQDAYVDEIFPGHLAPLASDLAQNNSNNSSLNGDAPPFQNNSNNSSLNGDASPFQPLQGQAVDGIVAFVPGSPDTNSSGTYVSSRLSSWASRSTIPAHEFDEESEADLMIDPQLALELDFDFGGDINLETRAYTEVYNYWLGRQ